MKQHLRLGVTLSLFACFLYSLMATIIKANAMTLPPLPMVIFLQNLVSFSLIFPILYKDGHHIALLSLKTHKLKLHILRSVFSLLISYLLYYSLSYIPLVNALLLSNAAPLIVPFVGYIFFAEKINHRLWLPVLIGYIGVACVLHPDAQLVNRGAILAFGSAVALAFTIQCVRKLTVTDSTNTITFYFLFFSMLISGFIAIPFWEPVTLQTLLVMIAIGLLYFTSQYMANASMRYANPQLISSLMYSNVLYAAIISLILWGSLPSLLTFIGILLIIVGGISCIRIEHISTFSAAKKGQLELHHPL